MSVAGNLVAIESQQEQVALDQMLDKFGPGEQISLFLRHVLEMYFD